MTLEAPQHPLDPLSPEEIRRVTAAVKAAPGFAAAAREPRFVTIEAAIPPKPLLLSGEPVPREAHVVLLDRVDGGAIEVAVALERDEVIGWEALDEQPLAVIEELSEAEDLVKADPEFRAAIAARGLDPDQIQIDAWPAGNFGHTDEATRRLARCVAFGQPRPGDSEWAHPVDGLIAFVDLTTLELLRIEDHGAVPVPPEPGNFDEAAAIAEFGGLRDDLREISITQPEGPSFEVEGNVVRWQKWELHVGFTPREGLVLNRVTYEDGGEKRSILHRASLAEMVVPYGDPSPVHFFKNAFDAGENGVGVACSSLSLGCDCLGYIHYFDACVSNGAGEPVEIENAICMHEEDSGILWKHVEWRTGKGHVRRGRRLVISSISAIGNYDYGFFWYLQQDGTIEFEVKLTGVLSTGAVEPGEEPRHGVLVAPGLNAMVHQHYFNFRLDFDLDGVENSVEEVWTESVPRGPENPQGNAFVARRRVLATESEAQRTLDPRSARYWEVTNPNRRHRLGRPVGYRLVAGENTYPFAAADAPILERAAFVRNHLWVTPFEERERYAAGEYPNQHPGGAGLPEWTAADRPIDNRDVVVWYTFGHHHVPRPEDWPVMPVARAGFALKPNGFFKNNPALDVPPPTAHCAPAAGGHCGADDEGSDR